MPGGLAVSAVQQQHLAPKTASVCVGNDNLRAGLDEVGQATNWCALYSLCAGLTHHGTSLILQKMFQTMDCLLLGASPPKNP